MTIAIPAPHLAGHRIPNPLRAVTDRVNAWRGQRRTARMCRDVITANAGRITVAEFMQRLGADDDTTRRYAGSFGAKVAEAYRATHDGQDPAKTGSAIVRGEIIPVYAYGWDQLELITRAAVLYAPVAALIGA